MTALMTMLLAFALFTGLAVELYKKWMRRGRTADWENRLAALVLSILLATVTFLVMDGSALPDGIRFSPWLIVVFSVLIYLLQLPACMQVWKPVVRKIIERKSDG